MVWQCDNWIFFKCIESSFKRHFFSVLSVWEVAKGSVNVCWQWYISVSHLGTWCLMVALQFTHIMYSAEEISMCSTLLFSTHLWSSLVLKCYLNKFLWRNIILKNVVLVFNSILCDRKYQNWIFLWGIIILIFFRLMLIHSSLVVVHCSNICPLLYICIQ